MRMAGLRPVQIWVPDTRQPGFAQECRRQSQIASQVDVADADMERFMDAALAATSTMWAWPWASKWVSADMAGELNGVRLQLN